MNWIEYNKFRTNLTFKEVRFILSCEAKKKYENNDYMFITRHTVLGRWREIKMKMFTGIGTIPNVKIVHNEKDFIF